MSDVTIDMTFPHEYEIEFPTQLSASATVPQIYYPGATTEGESTSLMCKVLPRNGKPWLACFSGDVGRTHGIYSTPDPRLFCAVAFGVGYFVDPEKPAKWEQIQTIAPICDVRALPEAGLLVFADYIRLAAYANHGWVWQTPRLCWDWLNIREVRGNVIIGTGLDAPNNDDGEFAVELSTGKVLKGLYTWRDA